jgi:hypothetical protein
MSAGRSDRFQRGGAGVYVCQSCKRNTRSTGRGDNENSQLCAQCYDLAGEVNSLSDDGHLYDVQGSRRAMAELVAFGVDAAAEFPEVAAELARLDAEHTPPALALAPSKPTHDQMRALSDWRSLVGRQWKSKLLAAWEVAGEGVRGYTPALQQLRNQFGPSWLVRAKITYVQTRTEAPMLSGRALTDELESQAIAALELIARNAAGALASARDNPAKAFLIMQNAPHWPGMEQAAALASSRNLSGQAR